MDKDSEKNDDFEDLTLAEVKEFISAAEKAREDFLSLADQSWNEVQKKNDRGNLRALSPRKSSRFQLWWMAWKIRQPIVWARMAVPMLKDTQGDDPIGRTACILGERLARSILKTFEPFSEFGAAVDDFLVTDFGHGRWFYRVTECLEAEKVRVSAMQIPVEPVEGQPPAPPQIVYVGPDGAPLDPETQILEDENGPYYLTGEEISVENEEVYFEAMPYNGLLVDPDAPRWQKVKRLAFKYEYTFRDFITEFGREALETVSHENVELHKSGKSIICYEYYDKVLRETRWFSDTGNDWIQPKRVQEAGGVEKTKTKDGRVKRKYENSDLYKLGECFPCAEPLTENASTLEFWPIPEYFQVKDILDDVHRITYRMMLLTRAIRVRFLYDATLSELDVLVKDAGEGDGIKVANLQRAMMGGEGQLDLRKCVAYFPIAELIQGLENMYKAFQQRLEMFYQMTGLSDLIRGNTEGGVQKTYGERQMEGKFALNRTATRQQKIQDWVKNNLEVGMEMALKLFSDKTLDDYITPATLDPKDKQRYVEALELLKNNKRRRFRVEFQTDATAAISADWKRRQATELANTLTKALESVANIANTQPEIAETELKVMKHLIGEFADGKQFIDEIQSDIEEVLKKSLASKGEEGPSPQAIELQKLKVDGQYKQGQTQLQHLKIQMQAKIEFAKIAQKERIEGLRAHLEEIKIGIENGAEQVELASLVEKTQNEIAQGWKDLELKEQALLANISNELSSAELAQFKTLLDARVKGHELTLEEADRELEQYKVLMEERNQQLVIAERVATEERLQEEHQANLTSKGVSGF